MLQMPDRYSCDEGLLGDCLKKALGRWRWYDESGQLLNFGKVDSCPDDIDFYWIRKPVGVGIGCKDHQCPANLQTVSCSKSPRVDPASIDERTLLLARSVK